LQGLPDDWTLIPVKPVSRARLGSPKIDRYVEIDGEPWQLTADGPRYRAIGNSMAVPVIGWILDRIRRAQRL
jgi:site-specific DNA-cytosine methylase